MTRNMSTLDRRLRTFVAAPVFLVVALLLGAGSAGGVVLLALAAVMVATSAVGSCPLYTLLHVGSRSHEPA